VSRNRCTCGAVEVVTTGEKATVRCIKCGWRYTYEAIPKRFEVLLRSLLAWFASREGGETDEEQS